jgi:hypothetical protein
MVRRRLIGVAVAAVVSVFGVTGPTNAATGCSPNAGSCTNGGTCSPNIYGTCDGGSCSPNVGGTCDHGACNGNGGYCGPGGTCSPNVSGRCTNGKHHSSGGCFFDADRHAGVTQPDTYVGVLGARVVTTDDNDPDPADVHCDLQVNGVPGSGDTLDVPGTATGVEAGAKQTTFVAHTADVLTLWTTITDSDESNVSDTFGNSGYLPLPPEEPLDRYGIIGGVFTGVIDPNTCPTLASLHGTYGPITIAADGDVTFDPDPLDLNPIDDCPPY